MLPGGASDTKDRSLLGSKRTRPRAVLFWGGSDEVFSDFLCNRSKDSLKRNGIFMYKRKEKKGTFLAHSQKIEPIKASQMYAACQKRGKKPAR